MNKFLQLLLSISLAVGLFFLHLIIGFWVLVALAVLFRFLRGRAKTEKSYFVTHYFYVYFCIYAVFKLILYFAKYGLAHFDFDTFFSNLVLFVVSGLLIAFLGMMLLKGVKALFNAGAWAQDPAANFAYVAIGFLSLPALMQWIGGVIEDGGTGGTLSILAIVFAFIPAEWLNLSGSGGYVPHVSDGPRKVILEDGTELTEVHGKLKDERNHEWEETVGGIKSFEDKGYKP